MFRPQITVVDCTIRDGGLMNNSNFDRETVGAVYRAIEASGVQVVELGYRNSKKMFPPDEYGPWRFCDEADLRDVVGTQKRRVKLAVMMDAHKCDPNDLLPKSESVIDVVRVATYVKDIDKAIAVERAARAKGYETTINIMSISTARDRELDGALRQIEGETAVKACYLVDSFGVLYCEDIDFYVEKFFRFLRNKEVGIHCHNNQQLAFANTIGAIIRGVNYLDGTLLGIGRGAGNCPLELLVGFLKNPRFDIRPVLDVIAKHILPLQETIQWGYYVPYMITGILNMHPDVAMKVMNLEKGNPARTDFRGFYDRCLETVS